MSAASPGPRGAGGRAGGRRQGRTPVPSPRSEVVPLFSVRALRPLCERRVPLAEVAAQGVRAGALSRPGPGVPGNSGLQAPRQGPGERLEGGR